MISMIYIGDLEDQCIDVHLVHTQAVYDLLKEKFWDKLNDVEKEDLESQMHYFKYVHLGGWRADLFNEAYRVLMASDDGWIYPLRESFEKAFKIDPRFQAA